MDLTNPVVRLCSDGMRAEADGRTADARVLFRQAWDSATDDYEACVAAHYLARHQPTPEQTLHWNQESLERANRVGDERVASFYASLHVNMATAYTGPDDHDRAREHFERAATHLDDVPPGQYADSIRFAIAEGLRTTGLGGAADRHLASLLARFRERGDLKALALILPVYVGDLGTTDDRLRLATALHMVHAARWLPEEEQQLLGAAIRTLNGDPAAGA